MAAEEKNERAQTRGAERDARWIALVESVAHIVWATDARGRGIHDPQLQKYSHLTWHAYTGQSLADSIGQGWLDSVHPDDRAQVVQAWDTVVATGENYRDEYRLRHRSGEWRWILSRGTAMRDANGALTGWLGTCTDITRRRQTEDALRDSQQRLLAALDAGQMGTWIWRLADNTIWWDEATVKLWGRVGNEVAEHALPDLMQYIHADDRDRVSEAMRQILQTGEATSVECRTIRPDGALQWLSARGRVERDAAGKPIQVVGAHIDITKLKVAEELLRQAQKMQALGTLAGGIAHDFNNLLLTIGGNARVALDELTAVHSAQAAQSALKEIVKANERAIELVRSILTFAAQHRDDQSAALSAVTVSDALQYLQSSIPNNAPMPTSARNSPFTPGVPEAAATAQAAQSGQGERILYVDDDEAIVFLITRVLDNAGYQVIGHTSPKLALRAFTGNPLGYDVVVTDLSMPEMSGFDLAREIKQIRPATPIVMTSGYVRPQDQARANELGIEHVILKPNTVEELGQVLDTLCRQMRGLVSSKRQ